MPTWALRENTQKAGKQAVEEKEAVVASLRMQGEHKSLVDKKDKNDQQIVNALRGAQAM